MKVKMCELMTTKPLKSYHYHAMLALDEKFIIKTNILRSVSSGTYNPLVERRQKGEHK